MLGAGKKDERPMAGEHDSAKLRHPHARGLVWPRTETRGGGYSSCPSVRMWFVTSGEDGAGGPTDL
jgi:hypothetical protein